MKGFLIGCKCFHRYGNVFVSHEITFASYIGMSISTFMVASVSIPQRQCPDVRYKHFSLDNSCMVTYRQPCTSDSIWFASVGALQESCVCHRRYLLAHFIVATRFPFCPFCAYYFNFVWYGKHMPQKHNTRGCVMPVGHTTFSCWVWEVKYLL